MCQTDLTRSLSALMKRDCLECPPTTPSCPSCPSGQVCSLIPQSCNECAHMTCIASATGSGGKSGPNVGAIAGGVIGGIAFVALVTFLVWRFFIRDRRQQQLEEEWEEEDDITTQKSQFQEQRDARASVHTVHSVASTMLSRASNMIPIAFIPGVTNRDGALNTPPVPPIPAARNYSPSPLSSGSHQNALFFMPGDLRNSAYSTTSSLDNRDTFIGRPSITPSLARESVTSEIYRDDATSNPMPATTVVRARPNMVSVKSSSSSPVEPRSGTATPVAISEYGPGAGEGKQPQILVPASTSGTSTPGSIRSNISFGKPTPVTIVKNKGRFPAKNASQDGRKPNVSSPLATADDESSDDDEEPHARARQSLLNPSRDSATTIQDTPASLQGPFADSQQSPPRSDGRQPGGGLSAVIEEATRRASRVPSHSGLGGRDASPFGDEHKI